MVGTFSNVSCRDVDRLKHLVAKLFVVSVKCLIVPPVAFSGKPGRRGEAPFFDSAIERRAADAVAKANALVIRISRTVFHVSLLHSVVGVLESCSISASTISAATPFLILPASIRASRIIAA